jgi:hypothetical protein
MRDQYGEAALRTALNKGAAQRPDALLLRKPVLDCTGSHPRIPAVRAAPATRMAGSCAPLSFHFQPFIAKYGPIKIPVNEREENRAALLIRSRSPCTDRLAGEYPQDKDDNQEGDFHRELRKRPAVRYVRVAARNNGVVCIDPWHSGF